MNSFQVLGGSGKEKGKCFDFVHKRILYQITVKLRERKKAFLTLGNKT